MAGDKDPRLETFAERYARDREFRQRVDGRKRQSQQRKSTSELKGVLAATRGDFSTRTKAY